MMTSSADPRPLTGSEQAGETFDEAANEFVAHGGCGQSLWFGPDSTDFVAELRVDVDVEADRAVEGEGYVATGACPTSLAWTAEPGAAEHPQAIDGF